jgi:amino acid adenylation domain-containing protein
LNKRYKAYHQLGTLHQRFEKQVLKNPNHIALSFSNTYLSYQALNQTANRLAHYLKRIAFIKVDQVVALFLDKNEYLVIAIIAVLKAGGGYVPIDPHFPDDRVNYILDEIEANVLICNQNYYDQLKQRCPSVLSIEDLLRNTAFKIESMENPINKTSSDNLCYVLYTSGTTGNPKGVLQTHYNILSLFRATESLYHFNDRDVWTLFHSYVFDFSVWEMWGALLYGGQLVIPTVEQTMNPSLLYRLCFTKKVTVLNLTPQVFYQFEALLNSPIDTPRLFSLRYIIFGGDRLNFPRLGLWLQKYGDRTPQMVNMYGITETAIHTTYKFISKDSIHQGSIIGQAIPDQTLYILDRFRSPVPYGVIGELYVGGSGLARGYLNHSTLTRNSFILNPFQTLEEKKNSLNQRIYKTGDLVRRLPNGDIEYIGRNDRQVKINGFRIELQAIERNITQYPGIRQAVVVVKPHISDCIHGNNQDLVAYYVAEPSVETTHISQYMSSHLPTHMCPSLYIPLTEIPLTSNGKVNYQALPEVTFKSRACYEAPKNKKEQITCQAFSEVLGINVWVGTIIFSN